jgi:hypothetical protein
MSYKLRDTQIALNASESVKGTALSVGFVKLSWCLSASWNKFRFIHDLRVHMHPRCHPAAFSTVFACVDWASFSGLASAQRLVHCSP